MHGIVLGTLSTSMKTTATRSHAKAQQPRSRRGEEGGLLGVMLSLVLFVVSCACDEACRAVSLS